MIETSQLQFSKQEIRKMLMEADENEVPTRNRPPPPASPRHSDLARGWDREGCLPLELMAAQCANPSCDPNPNIESDCVSGSSPGCSPDT